MKIGIDIRNLEKTSNFYSFIIKQIESLTKNDREHTYIIYSSDYINISDSQNYENKIIKNENCKLKEQYILIKQYKQDKIDLMIYTSIFNPLLFKGKNIFILESLKKLIYPDNVEENIIKKYIYKLLFRKTLRKADLILTLDSNTKLNINESYNIKESKISLLPAFFNTIDNKEEKIIDIKLKHNLKNDYIIYEGGTGSNKNILRLLNSIKKINNNGSVIDIIFLGNKTKSDFEIKNILDNEGTTNNIHLITDIQEKDKKDYYKQSIGFIFPSLYESFPFCMNKAISYNTRILSSNLDSIKEIFGNSIEYINPLSNINIKNNLELFVKDKESETNYKKVTEKYNIENSTSKLLKFIKNI